MVVVVIIIVVAGLVEDFAECSDYSLLGTRRHIGWDWLGLPWSATSGFAVCWILIVCF